MPIFYKDQGRVLFAHIPKSAGSSVCLWFGDNGWFISNMRIHQHGRVGKEVFKRFGIIQFQLEAPLEPNVSPQHSVASTFKQWGEFTSGFCIVRHPWDRFISELGHYLRLICRKRNIQHLTKKMVANYVRSFIPSAFKEYEKTPQVRDNHIRPQVDFISDITTVLYLESDWKNWLKEQYDLKDQPPVHNKQSQNINFEEFISEDLRRMIIDFYQKDFEWLGYEEQKENSSLQIAEPYGQIS